MGSGTNRRTGEQEREREGRRRNREKNIKLGK